MSVIQRQLRRALFERLGKLSTGRLTVLEGAERREFGRATEEFPISATLHVLDPRFYAACALRGNLGAAEAFMDGYWRADDLTMLVRILARNPDVSGSLDRTAQSLVLPFLRLYHWLHRNTRGGSRRNIRAHYDLGNDFFELLLDPTLTYSCGVFEREDSTLEEASIAKYDRICRKLELSPVDRVLEIGSGWGGFAVHAAGRYGCRVTATTISSQQYELARKRVADAGLGDRITLLKRDYRDLEGQFDKLVSIEMIEAVGHKYFDAFFKACSDLLKPDGMMCLQAITVADQRYEQHTRNVDFVKRYIFPGASLPSVGKIADCVARVTDLRLFHLEDITPHYAKTLCCWRENLFKNLERVRALGYPERFIRMWEFYLRYCEGAFLERANGDIQLLLTKPLCRREPILA